MALIKSVYSAALDIFGTQWHVNSQSGGTQERRLDCDSMCVCVCVFMNERCCYIGAWARSPRFWKTESDCRRRDY